MAIRAVVFDLDGLMFNTEEIFPEVGKLVLSRRGKEMTPDLLTLMMGRRAYESCQVMIDYHDLEDHVEVIVQESANLFFEIAEGKLGPMPGLYELLQVIEQRNLPKGVATSSSRPYLERILGMFDIRHRFPLTLTAEDVTHGKPHPEIYLTAAANLGVKPEEMLVLEDSQTGTMAGAAAGAHIVSIPHQNSHHQDFSMAKFVAERLDDPRVLALLRTP